MPSKLQVIVDEVLLENAKPDKTEAIKALLKAIELIAKGQQQVMRDVENVRFYGEQPIK